MEIHIKEGIFNPDIKSVHSGKGESKVPQTNALKPTSHLIAVSKDWKPSGLKNLGNTCYLNSIVQCLLGCEVHSKFLRLSKNANSDLVVMSFLKLLECKIEIVEFRDILCTSESFFDSTGQQDAHEALILLLEVLHRSTFSSRIQELGLSQLSQDSSQLSTSAVRNTFQGSFRIVTQCSFCLKSKPSFENFQEIEIGLKGDVSRSLSESLLDTITKHCPQCNCDTSHSVTKAIWQQPKITILRIQRFKQMTTGRIHKNTEKLCLKETFSISGFKASLIGSVSHIGPSTTSGHYISHVKVVDDWYCCSDENIKVTKFSTFSDSKECYLLFYIMTA